MITLIVIFVSKFEKEDLSTLQIVFWILHMDFSLSQLLSQVNTWSFKAKSGASPRCLSQNLMH